MRNSRWARWPWERCPAVTIDAYGPCRCDLKRGHYGGHIAERGMYDVRWSHENHVSASGPEVDL